MGMHNDDTWIKQNQDLEGENRIAGEFPQVPEKIHAIVMDTLENLQERDAAEIENGGRTMKIKKRRLIYAAAALAAMFGTTVAAAELFLWNDKAVEYFDHPSQEVQNEMAVNNVAVEQTDFATDQGITVTAVQTVQDNNRVYILLDVETEDALIDSNSAFNIWNVITEDPEAFNNLGAAFGEGTPAAREEKGCQGYYEINALKTIGREWNEDSIELELGEFIYYTYEDDMEIAHVVDGTWKLTIPLGEQTEAITRVCEAGDPVMIEGYPVTLKEVELSPISTVLIFDLDEELEMIKHVYSDQEDVFVYELQLRGFVYDTGERIACGHNGISEHWDREAGTDIREIALSRIIQPDKVTAVLLGDGDTPLEDCVALELK